MKKTCYYFLFVLNCLIPCLGIAQGIVLTPQELKTDFEIFRGSLEEMHPGLYWYSSKKEIDSVFEAIDISIAKEMTDLEFYRLLSRAISKIRCVHTWILPAEKTNHELLRQGPLLPIELKLIEGRAYFFKSKSKEQLAIEPGQQILSINGYSIDALLQLSNKVRSGDGWTTTGKERLFELFFHYFYVTHVGQPETYELTYFDQGGKVKNVVIKAMPFSEFNQKQSSNDKSNIELDIINDHTAYLKVRAFDNWRENGKKKKFLTLVNKAFIKIDSSKADNLIVDIRDNWGGTERYGLALCSYFTDSSFYGYKEIRFKNNKFKYRKYSKTNSLEFLLYKTVLNLDKVNDTTYLLQNDNNTDIVKPSSPQFSGNVYILINGSTYSTASDFSALMHSKGLATFIGEETGGGYRGNSGDYEFEFVLPNSKIRFNAPLAQYLTNVTYEPENYGRGVIPDHIVKPMIENLIQEADTELDFTLKLIKKD